MQARERLIFALDVDSVDKAVDLVTRLRDEVGVFKIGLELFTAEGPEVVRAVRRAGADAVFLDLKLHDIPATMRSAAKAAVGLGVEMLTCHCDQMGIFNDMDLGATKLLGITVLTSLGSEDLAAMGYPPALQDPASLVIHRAALARRAGCAGVVCSGREAAAVRGALGPDALIICPGIRPSGEAAHDQKRVVTPAKAVRAGASHIVVGRPIREAPDPAAAAAAIVAEVHKTLDELGLA